MKAYIVKLINGDELKITEAEYQALAGKTGLVFVPSCQETINVSSITHIYAEEKDDVKNRAKQKFGVLHDGSIAVKQFGEWFDAMGPIDERGYYLVRFDPEYYPEAAKDCVPSPEEYKSLFEALPPAKRLERMLGTNEPKRLGNSGFVAIAQIAEANP